MKSRPIKGIKPSRPTQIKKVAKTAKKSAKGDFQNHEAPFTKRELKAMHTMLDRIAKDNKGAIILMTDDGKTLHVLGGVRAMNKGGVLKAMLRSLGVNNPLALVDLLF